MGTLYDYCARIEEHIEREHLDIFRTRGELALRAGFLISLVCPEDPDDSEKIMALREAAAEVLDLQLS